MFFIICPDRQIDVTLTIGPWWPGSPVPADVQLQEFGRDGHFSSSLWWRNKQQVYKDSRWGKPSDPQNLILYEPKKSFPSLNWFHVQQHHFISSRWFTRSRFKTLTQTDKLWVSVLKWCQASKVSLKNPQKDFERKVFISQSSALQRQTV